jgi:phosphatidylglycerol---prolipoprotein diacylglyceryl transferase
VIEAAIQFPQIDPAALSLPAMFGVGPFHLRWYALAYIVGLVLGWRWMVWLIRREKLWAPGKPSVTAGQTDDFLFWATLGVILGGRLGYVLFYKTNMIWDIGPNKPWWSGILEVFQIWEGGMSFHGGLIGVALAAWWFASKPRFDPHLYQQALAKHASPKPPEKNQDAHVEISSVGWVKKTDAEKAQKQAARPVSLLGLGDIAAAAAPIGLFFGRIANFINGELWGRHTDAPWGVVFPEGGYDWDARKWVFYGNETARHPSQLYEAALEGLVLFAIVNFAIFRFKSLARPGLNIGLFLVCYGAFRFLLEFVRNPDEHMPEALKGAVTMGMLLSVPMILAGAWLIRRACARATAAA